MDMKEICSRARLGILDMIYKTGGPHIGSSFSMVEALAVLYFKVMDFGENRDRFLLSKGHACPGLYAILHLKGLLSDEDIEGFAVNGGTLEQHPMIDTAKGIEAATGSLGHGLSLGNGMALAAKHDSSPSRVFVMLGDGELNEGMVWESALFAAHHKLDNLTVMIDRNKIQALGDTEDVLVLEPIEDKWKSFGWDALRVDGHDMDAVESALNTNRNGKPLAIVLDTVKGKGVSFMEDKLLWHYRAPDDDEYTKAVEELQV
ncbi:transketolase [Limisalsivibrio acetivorans]|uniref:transketolase n=1 Tax=Limisalsivibrio acetivorans TaxID=1304888 RepID=UPI0003B392E8|nr:transketolase [Limisalsivibrio acetivorans]